MSHFDTECQAASGDHGAQREMIDHALKMGRTGMSTWRDSVEHALWWARLADRRATVLAEDPIWRKISIPNFDTVRLFRVLELCASEALARGDTDRHDLYLGEMICVADELADRGDADAEQAIGAMPDSVTPRVLEIAKALRSLRQEDGDSDEDEGSDA